MLEVSCRTDPGSTSVTRGYAPYAWRSPGRTLINTHAHAFYAWSIPSGASSCVSHETGLPMSTSLGSFIRERRQELGLTQEQLAERIGVNVRQAEVSRLESGRIALPRRERMELLAAALEVSLGELLVRSGWMDEGDALPDRDPDRDIDLIAWSGPVPEDVDGMALPELVAMLERISEAQDQLTVASIALEDARKAVTAEMQEELAGVPHGRDSEIRPKMPIVDDRETPTVLPA